MTRRRLATRGPRIAGVLSLACLAACSAHSSASACGYASARRAALPTEPAPRFHIEGGPDPLWRSRLTSELQALRADSSVHALFLLDSAVIDPDRALVRSYGATITDEPGFLVGIVATVRVDSLRHFVAADSAVTARVRDVDLVTVTVLPECR